MNTPEPFWHWQWWQREMTLQRALTAEADTQSLAWKKTKLQNRLQKHVRRLGKRGWFSMTVET